MMLSSLILVLSYLLGSIPFGLLTSRIFNLQDPRTVGSRNIGTTNILRSGHKLAALLTFLGDAAKGSLSVFMALKISPSLAPFAGLCAVLGHVFPLWLNFKGGKGIATMFGVIFLLNWPLGILSCVTWMAFFLATNYASLASLMATMTIPLYAFFLEDPVLLKLGLIFSGLFLWTHRSNLSRLFKGREQKIGAGKPPGTS